MLFFYSRMVKITHKVLKELRYIQYNSFVNLSISLTTVGNTSASYGFSKSNFLSKKNSI